MLKLRHFTGSRDSAPAEAAACPRRPERPAASAGDRSLLPSAGGRIRHVFLVATRRMPGFDQGMAQRVLRLAGGFERLSLAVHAEEEDVFRRMVAGLGLAARTEFIVAPAGAALWPWAQDRVTVFHDDAGATLVVAGGDAGDWSAEAAARASGIAGAVALEGPPPGGNILADGPVCLVGADLDSCIVETRRAIEVVGCDPLERRGPRRFEIAPGDHSWRQDIDRSIAAPGARQPIFHIDMFVTLAGTVPDGRPRILLGDPAWASDLIGLPLPEGFPAEAFAEIDRALRARGFVVLRNPLPFIYFDDPEAKLREWFYASANNCWVECTEAGNRVFLPEYGFGAWSALKATDYANAAIWEDLGFEVVRGGDFLPLADQLGSLNCVSRILDRA